MSSRARTSGLLRRIGRNATVVLAIASMLGLATIGEIVASEAAPAGAATVARDGLSAKTASPSCWSIKQSYPASADGIYWLSTPKLIDPEQFYCDMTTDGGGWVLIGRGREGWSFPYWGENSPSTLRNTVTGPGAFVPSSLPTPTVDGLMNGGRMDGLADGIRLRRATDTAGTTWQEARLNVKTFGSWSWAFGGGIPLSSVTFDGVTTDLATSNYQTNTTSNIQIAQDTRKVTTYPMSGHNFRAGFSYGTQITNGTQDPNSYLWEYANENSAVPFTQVFIRPEITDEDVIAAGVSYAPDTGIAGTTVRKMLDRTPVSQGWAVTGLNAGLAVSNQRAYVHSFAQIGNTIYMGGKFLQVQHGVGGPTFTQSYLAAFDVTTGEWIPTFNPVIDAPVWKILASPDGTKLFVGGEFTNVNGVANTTALAALDPATGAPVPATSWLAYGSRPSGTYDIRAMSIQGQWLYLGGNFTRISGGTGFNFAGPLTMSRLARVRLSDGRPDWNWLPTLETAPMDIHASSQGDRVYAVGAFSVLNGVTLNPNHQAIIDTVTGAAVPGLKPWTPTQAGVTEPSNTILEVGDHVYQGGSQHYLHSYTRSDYTFERGFITQNAGGDYQAMAYKDGILYGGCHCVTDYQFQDTTAFSNPAGYSRVDPINLIGAYDTTTNLSSIPEFHPTQLKLSGSGGEGPWALFVDNSGCMWAGGDLVRQGAAVSPYYGGYEKFCDRDTQAPAVPNVNAAVSGSDVTLSWSPSADNASTPVNYEILKDDPAFGTVVVGTTFERTYVDTGVTGTARYFVRAIDATGNRSATTPVISVTPPPPTAGIVISHGDTWSYRADGQNLGTTWSQPGFDSSAWATGASQLGWGNKGETTAIPTGPITSYFVKHQNIANPTETYTIRLKRDDGAAVYVNGVPVVRDNLPAGALTASTPASSFTSGTGESNWYEYQVPGSLFTAGDNTIAVEVHQGALNNADGIFDLELVARNGSETNDPTVPQPTVTNVDFSSATLSWAAATDDSAVVGYIVRRNGNPVSFTPGTSFIDTGLDANTAYSYSVASVDNSGNVSAAGSVNTTTAGNPAVIASGAAWSYLGTTTDPGTAWRQPGFDASAWPTGSSQLGWGNKGEATVVPVTGTQYYVKHFSVDDPSQFPKLNLRLVRDDGAAVYINGIEVRRDNLPAGALTSNTRSSSAMAAPAERTWFESTLPGNLLVAGDNVIAVEVHQDSATNADSLFNLELVRQTPTETNPPTRPTLTVGDVTATSVAFTWTAASDDAGVLGYAVRRNGTVVGYTTGTSFTDTGLNANTAYAYQVVSLDTSGNASTPGSLLASTISTSFLVQHGDVWSYKATATDPGTAWRQPAFDASSWATGPSQLGWGGRGESTTVPAGTLASYYVRHFNVSNPSSLGQLTLRVKRDDGVAIYVNGTELVRDNLPAGTLTASTYPSSKVTAADGIAWKTFTIPSSALVAGDNVIAAEVHQDSKTDTRGVFDLELQSTVASTAPIVTLTTPVSGSFATTPTTLSGLCTTAAGTVTVNITGTQPTIVTAPCVANDWTVSTTLPEGAYSATASQTDPSSQTGTSGTNTFTIDSLAPVVTLTTPASGSLLGSAAPTYSGECSTGDGNVKITLTGAASANLSTPCVAGTWSAAGSALATGLYSVQASQTDAAANVGTSAASGFSVDATAPVTTDNTATIGNAWKATSQTVTLSATDAGGAGVGQTYYTTNGATPTTASATGTSVTLSASGTYTVKYFSVDSAGNAEAVKTAGTQIRIDTAAPTQTFTFPANGGSYNAASWTAGCTPTARICGTAADTGSGLASVRMIIQRSNNSQYWTGTAWQAASATITASGTATWSVPLATNQLANGVTYTITSWSVDASGNTSANTVRTFTYDTAAPTTAAASIVTANKNGAINVNADTFAVTFNEALNASTVPSTATLTLSRSNGNTSYSISGLTNGLRTTGSTGYLTSSGTTRTVTYAGTLVLSNANKTVTFTVTGACAGTCSAVSTTKVSGAYQYVPATTLTDVAGNLAATTTITASSQTIF